MNLSLQSKDQTDGEDWADALMPARSSDDEFEGLPLTNLEKLKGSLESPFGSSLFFPMEEKFVLIGVEKSGEPMTKLWSTQPLVWTGRLPALGLLLRL